MKRPGRKPLDPRDPSVKVTISLPTKQFDHYCAAARRQDLSLPEVIRRALEKTLKIPRAF
jgi:hypothetical protein